MSLPVRFGVALTKTDKTRFYSSVSSCLSIQKVCQLVLKTKTEYDRVILVRPDVFYINPVSISDFEGVTTERLSPVPPWLQDKEDVNGDLHIELSSGFCHLFSKICSPQEVKNNFLTHSWLADLCIDLKIPYRYSTLETGRDLEVFRKISNLENQEKKLSVKKRSVKNIIKRILLLPIKRSFW
jgi:hypothetical protein